MDFPGQGKRRDFSLEGLSPVLRYYVYGGVPHLSRAKDIHEGYTWFKLNPVEISSRKDSGSHKDCAVL